MLHARRLCGSAFLVACVVQGQLPSSSRFNAGGGALPASADAMPMTVQAGVQGIAGLMQRFEQLQPQFRSLPQHELERVVAEGQQLHERFMELQGKMRAAEAGARTSAGIGSHLEEQVLRYHNDLALFVGSVEGKLGIMGPGPTAALQRGSSFGGASLTRESSAGAAMNTATAADFGARRSMPSSASGSAVVSSSTDQRLQAVMNAVVQGMQRFEALHPKFQALPQQVFQSIANRGQQLHEEFVSLQRRGMELAGDGTKQMTEADAATYAAQMEDFVTRQRAFVGDAEAQVASSTGGLASAGTGLPPARAAASYGGMMGAQLPVPPQPQGSGFGASPPQIPGAAATGLGLSDRMPPLSGAAFGAPSSGTSSFGGASSPAGEGRITPATDRRLSAVIEKVVARMQEFEALKPQFSRLPQQVFTQIAQRGQSLNDRFVLLQQRGATIAGDGSVPMLERDASAYAADMEAFQQDQAAFVDQAKQAVQSGGAGAGLGGATLGSAGLRPPGSDSIGLGGASLGSGGLRPPASSASAGFSGPGLGDATPGSGTFTAPSSSGLGASSFGASGPGGPTFGSGAGYPLGASTAAESGTTLGAASFGGPSFGRAAAGSSGSAFGNSGFGSAGSGKARSMGASSPLGAAVGGGAFGSLQSSERSGFGAAGSLSRSALASHAEGGSHKAAVGGNQDLQAGLLRLGKVKLDTGILPDSMDAASLCTPGEGDGGSCVN